MNTIPAFREVNTGQIVTTTDPARIAFFQRLARWEQVDNAKPETHTRPEPVAETPATTEPETTATPNKTDNKPADDAPRAEWVAYALANGKTEEDLHRVRVNTIKEWFE